MSRFRLSLARSKYGARPTFVDGIRFASQGEALRYAELRLLETAGEISKLELQPRFPLIVHELKFGHEKRHDCGTYIADFRYRDKDGNLVIEDYKGFDTPLGRLKRKLASAIHGVEIRVIRGTHDRPSSKSFTSRSTAAPALERRAGSTQAAQNGKSRSQGA